MRKKRLKRIIYLIGTIAIIIWAVGFWGYWGIPHTITVMGLIITAFILIFIGVILEDDFL